MKLEQWIQSRALDEEVVAKLSVREYVKDGRAWIEIPYTREGRKVNAKHRCLDEKLFFQEKDGEKIFYNHDILFDETLDNQPVYITEGEVDAWTMIQCGFIKTVSVPEGAPNEIVEGDSKKYSYLKQYIPVLKKAPYVVLLTDNDQNGKNLLHDLSMRIGKGKCHWVKYPKDCKDINDALMKYGQKGVVKSIETHQPLSMDGVYQVSKLPPVAEAKAYSSGMEGLRDKFFIRLGDFSVITGIPSMGKTTFVNDLICNLVINNGLNVCFASLEQHPSLDHVRNLRAWYMGKYPDANSYQADLWIDKYFSFIYPSDEQQLNDELDLEWFLKHAEYAVEAMGAKVVILDPWNELEHVPYSDQSLTEYVGMAIRKLKRFAKIMNVHVMVVAHPTKQQKNKEGEFQIPTLYDISDSANWFNKPELGAVVHRDENGDTIFKIAKSRYWDVLGKPAVVKYRFDEKTKHFHEIL